jgi:hypothetical protein
LPAKTTLPERKSVKAECASRMPPNTDAAESPETGHLGQESAQSATAFGVGSSRTRLTLPCSSAINGPWERFLRHQNKAVTRIALGVSLGAALAIGLAAARPHASVLSTLTPGEVHLVSAGPLAFGPDGILFVGDSAGAAVVALDTNDRTPAHSTVKIDVQGIDTKIAALVGVMPEQIMINGVAVNPISRNAYISVSRGRGPDALPLIVRVDGSGAITILPLKKIKHASASLIHTPEADPDRQYRRMLTITSLAYVNGSVMVAGLSNEEWSSALRSIPFPFRKAQEISTLQIWNSSHGVYETEAPVRTFVPYTIGGQPYILAAYTCTPLVKIPISDLKPGAKVEGVTIADLGRHNQPLDMIPYRKDGHDYILIANTRSGMLRLRTDHIESYQPLDTSTIIYTGGVPFDKIHARHVQHIAQLDSSDALVLSGRRASGPDGEPLPGEGLNLETVALP